MQNNVINKCQRVRMKSIMGTLKRPRVNEMPCIPLLSTSPKHDFVCNTAPVSPRMKTPLANPIGLITDLQKVYKKQEVQKPNLLIARTEKKKINNYSVYLTKKKAL